MSVQNFITDFYINKTGEVPSETMVNEIVGKYGDNYDELISDMSMQVGGEQFNTDHINRIKTQYKMMSVNDDVKKKVHLLLLSGKVWNPLQRSTQKLSHRMLLE